MKKLNLLAAMVLLIVSCQKDDESFVPLPNTTQNTTDQTLTDTSAMLEWDAVDSAESYTIEYGITGFERGAGTLVTTSSTSVNLTDLIADTTYDYYVQPLSIDNNVIIRSIRRFTTRMAPFVPEFRPNLSELKLFRGTIKNLIPSSYALDYDLNTKLYTNYAEKQRLIFLPLGTSMIGTGDGLPDFPNKTVVAKTFYYNKDDRNLSLGKIIVETRVMIKLNGQWEFGDYVWNEEQTEAVLDNSGSTTTIDWIDMEGANRNVTYKIPSQEDCFTCHQTFNVGTLIGPKLRSMNFNINGMNQLQKFINQGYLTNVTDVSAIGQLPNWENTALTDEQRVRAYLDVNCAHCHSAGGFHNNNYYDALNLAYETSFEDSHILTERLSMMARIQTSIEGYSMPYIGVTTPHQQAVDLIVPYLQSLE